MADETKNSPLGSCKGNSFDRRLLLLSRAVCYARDDTSTGSSYLACQFNWQKGAGLTSLEPPPASTFVCFSCMSVFSEAARGLIPSRNCGASSVRQFHKKLQSTYSSLKATIEPLPAAGFVPLPPASAIPWWLSCTTENWMPTGFPTHRQQRTTAPTLLFQFSRQMTQNVQSLQDTRKTKPKKVVSFSPHSFLMLSFQQHSHLYVQR